MEHSGDPLVRERLLTDTSDEALPLPSSRSASWLLWIIIGVVATLLVWAFFAELDTNIRGQGRVIPSSQLQVVSNLEGGIIESIFVRTGEEVEAGDPILALDQTETGSSLTVNLAGSDNLRARVARLEAEVAGRLPAFPSGGTAALQEQVRIESALYRSRQADLASLVNAADARLVQSERAVSEALAALEARREAARAAAQERDLLRPLVQRGIEPRLSLVQAESAAAMAQSEVAAATASVTRARAAVSEATASRAQQIQQWRSAAANELAAAQGELATERGAQPALRERLDRTTVRAPLDGKINRVLKNTVGGSVSPGEPLAEIVPSGDTLLIEARITPQDIGWVALGQRASVNITAYDPVVYGGLDGEVVTIAPDAQVDERTGESFYLVQVRTNSAALRTEAGDELPIGSGMVAEVLLIGEKRSVLDYLLRPINRVSQRAFRE